MKAVLRPTHSSLLQLEKLSCQPRSLAHTAFMNQMCKSHTNCVILNDRGGGSACLHPIHLQVSVRICQLGQTLTLELSPCLFGSYYFRTTLRRASGNFFVQPHVRAHTHTFIYTKKSTCPWDHRPSQIHSECTCYYPVEWSYITDKHIVDCINCAVQTFTPHRN